MGGCRPAFSFTRLLVSAVWLVLPALYIQGCFFAAAPFATEAETTAQDVAPTGAWDLAKALVAKPSPLDVEKTRLQIERSKEELSSRKAELERMQSEKDATIGVLEDLWNWQHDPAIGDLLIYVKAGGDPAVAMRVAMERLNQRSSFESCVSQQPAKPVAQSSYSVQYESTN